MEKDAPSGYGQCIKYSEIIFYLKMLLVKEFLSISHWCWKEFTQRCYHAIEIASIFFANQSYRQ